jgi:hypothetical protein
MFLCSEAVPNTIIYKYKYVTDIMKVVLNCETLNFLFCKVCLLRYYNLRDVLDGLHASKVHLEKPVVA